MKSDLYKCPVCKQTLDWMYGDPQMHPNNKEYGVSIFCNNMECGMSDLGHGNNEKNAFEVFQNKCTFGQTKQR